MSTSQMTDWGPEAPKYVQTKRAIQARILAGEFSPGSVLPSEEELAESFAVGRNTLRSALQLLRDEGVITSGQGRKSIVVEPNRRSLKKIVWLNYGQDDSTEPVYLKEYNHFLREAQKEETHVMFLTLQDRQDEEWFLKHVTEIDGLVVAGLLCRQLSSRIREKFDAIENMVGVDYLEDSPARNFFCVDNYQGGRLAAETLLQRGYRNILVAGVIPSIHTYSPFAERLRGFCDVMIHCGVPEVRMVMQLSEREDDFFQEKIFLEKALRANQQIDAIFTLTDKYAVRCVESLLQMGIAIPEQLGVLGYDGSPIGESCRVPLTTICQPFEEVGRAAYRFLQENINAEHRSAGSITKMAPYLVERASLRKG